MKAGKCKHWLYLSCPEFNNLVMNRFKFKESDTPYYLKENDFNELKKLCAKCNKFEEDKTE